MMRVSLVVCVFAVMAVVTAIRPRAGANLLWFAVWLYPTTLMYGLLPLDIRLDDLFIVYTFIICLAWYPRRARKPFHGAATTLAAAWFLVQLIGNLSGMYLLREQYYIDVVKSVAKCSYIPMTVFIFSSLVRTRADVQRTMRWLCVAGVATAMLGIASVYFPSKFWAFRIPGSVQGYTVGEYVEAGSVPFRRAAGSLGIMSTTAVLLNISLLALSNSIFKERGKGWQPFYVLCFGLSALGLIYTQTRGAFLAFAAALLWGIFRSRRRLAFAVVFLVGACVLLYEPALLHTIVARFTGETGSSFAQGESIRVGIWETLLTDFQPIFLLTGVGMDTSHIVFGTTAHNSYLGAFVYTGIFGVCVLIAIIAASWKLATKLLRRARDNQALLLGTYMRMLLIATLILGMTLECFWNTRCMQLFFVAMLLAERILEQSDASARTATQDPSMRPSLSMSPRTQRASTVHGRRYVSILK